MPSLIARLTNLETSFGHPLPDIYRRYLLQGRAVCESEVVFENDASEFDIRTVFGLTSSSECDQIDATYRIVKKVIPPDSLPIACDWGDNFFCSIMEMRRYFIGITSEIWVTIMLSWRIHRWQAS